MMIMVMMMIVMVMVMVMMVMVMRMMRMVTMTTMVMPPRAAGAAADAPVELSFGCRVAFTEIFRRFDADHDGALSKVRRPRLRATHARAALARHCMPTRRSHAR